MVDVFSGEAAPSRRLSGILTNSIFSHESNAQEDLSVPKTSRKYHVIKRRTSISVDKLNFAHLDLYGREKEVELLTTAFNEIRDRSHGRDRSLTMIEGHSGSGKSVVAGSLKKVAKSSSAFYALGKFHLDEHEPLSAISEALVNLLDQVLELKNRDLFETIKQQITTELAPEFTFLSGIVPKIMELLPQASATTVAGHPTISDSYKDAVDHLNYSITKLIQIIATHVPVVIVCDDLQWSDPESIALIKTLVTDADTKAVMMIGCYRSSKVDCTHRVSQMFDEIESYSSERRIHIQKIAIEAPSIYALGDYLMDLLSTDREHAMGLAAIVIKKTGGNMFSVKQFLITLTKRELLCYNIGQDRWVWDNDLIQAKAIATKNVVDMMKRRLNDVEVAKKILPIAACLGSTFTLHILKVILDQYDQADTMIGGGHDSALFSTSSEFIRHAFATASSDLIEEAFSCEDKGFIEDLGAESYCFVHDKVQEAALKLLPDNSAVKFRIGEIMWRSLEESEVQKNIFVIVGLLNSRLDLVPNGFHYKWEVSKLHYRAGCKAVAVSAFRSASFFFSEALALLPEESWGEDLQFCLDLYASAAETEFCMGDFEKVQEYAKKVTHLKTCQPIDKIRMYNVLIDSLSCEHKEAIAIDVGIDFLSQLGCKFPKSKVAVLAQSILGVMKTKGSVKNASTLMEALPVTNDPAHLGIMKTLAALIYPIYSSKPEVGPHSGSLSWGVCKMLFPSHPHSFLLQLFLIVCHYLSKYTFKYGITSYAPLALGFQGFILLHVLGDFNGAKVYAEHAMRMIKVHDCKVVEARMLFMIQSGVCHWLQPLSSVLPAYVEIYNTAMRAGQCEDGLKSIYYYLEAAMFTGRELGWIEKDLVTYMHQMVDLKQDKALFWCKCLLQSIRNLRGKSPNTTVLTGTVMDEDESMAHYVSVSDQLLIAGMYRRKMILACYFGEHKLNADLGLTRGDFVLSTLIGQTSVPVLAFVLSLSSFAMARHAPKPAKYKHQALKYRKMIKKWSSYNPNCVPYLKILDAEKAVLKGKIDDAINMYVDGITMTGRIGSVHNQALTHERMADLYLERKEPQEAKYRLEKAIELYSEWGATKKVGLLRQHLQEITALRE
jgi:predicted ATPase